MSQDEEFLRKIRESVKGTPYVVDETDEGFDLTLDIVDAKWFGLYHKEGLERVHTYHVQLVGDGTYTVTDDSRTVEWQAGVPTLSASVEVTRGRVWERSSEKVWALGEDLRFGPVVDYRFNSEEGRQLITAVADSLGLKEPRGRDEKIGLYLAMLGGVGALVTVIVLGVVRTVGQAVNARRGRVAVGAVPLLPAVDGRR